MELGAFSISLAVEDLEASRDFYEKLGFEVVGGDPSQNWQILRNGDHTIGLFQGMFEQNILTFNPGWDRNANPLDTFTDVRELQRRLKARGAYAWSTRRMRTAQGRPALWLWTLTAIQSWWINTSDREGCRPWAQFERRPQSAGL